MFDLLFLVFLFPLLGFLILAFGRGRIPENLAAVIGVGSIGLSALTTALIGFQFLSHPPEGGAYTQLLWNWIDVGQFHPDFALRLDGLSLTMMGVITGVGFFIHLFASWYMRGDDGYGRFFSYMNLFVASMLFLVLGDNLLFLYFGWEGVGLCSYLLIGFWYKDPANGAAARKAFVVTRVGDVFMALGLFLLFNKVGTLNIQEAMNIAPQLFQPGSVFITAIALLLLGGAMGKSAQIPLQTWLPDAMEGPTPVSALIHAATMVTAGVFLVARMSPLFELSQTALTAVTLVGTITAFFAASVGLVQNDIKRVIAYSTCSQLGYMFFAAGVGAYQAAMFHLFTHAFFKALLFLGAGSVIHGMHHEQDMRKMGGLWKYLPITYGVMTIGTIAITGLGIPETQFGFAGFFSKDAIIESAWAAHNTPQGMFAFCMGIAAALLTSFYSWRLIAMTFHGKKHWEHGHDDHHHDVIDGHDASEPAHDDHGHDDHHGHGHDHKPHESPWVMLVPICLLAVGAVFAGVAFAPYFIGEHAHEFWGHAIFTGPTNHIMHEAHEIEEMWVKLAPLAVTLLGMLLAWYYYIARPNLPKQMAAKDGPVYNFLYHKWYFDEIYQATFVRLTRILGDFFWKVLDIKIIDNLGPNGAAWTALKSAKNLVKTQTGYVYHYAFAMFLGVVGLLTYVFWLVH